MNGATIVQNLWNYYNVLCDDSSAALAATIAVGDNNHGSRNDNRSGFAAL